MTKIINYCWFGGKPLPKKIKQYIRTWKKYLPDYEIKEWNEKNFDINITNFSKEAYKNKKWAFVSDVARIYALKEVGGIYLDTDIEVVKSVDFLLKNEFFIGKEDTNFIATCVIGTKSPNNQHINAIFDIYKKAKFNTTDMYSITSPNIITKYLETKGLLPEDKTQELSQGIKVYSRDYFSPKSYDNLDDKFTKNTCMIHHFSGSWTSPKEKISMFFIRHKMGFIVKFASKLIRLIKSDLPPREILRRLYYNYCNSKLRKLYYKYYKSKKRLAPIKEKISNLKQKPYIAIHHPEWLGVTVSTKELFKNTLELKEIEYIFEATEIAKLICEKKPKVIFFSAIAKGWIDIIKEIKKINKSIIIKVIWHGSNALLCEPYDFQIFTELLQASKEKYVNQIAFVKKSMYEYYKKKGFNVYFLMNTINIKQNLEITSLRLRPTKRYRYNNKNRSIFFGK